MSKILYIFILVFLCNCKTEKKEVATMKPVPEKEINSTVFKYVSAKSGLKYREKPKGKSLGKLAFGDKIEITENTAQFESITDNGKTIKGEWLGFKIDNKTVYAFGGYLIDKQNIKGYVPNKELSITENVLNNLGVDKSECIEYLMLEEKLSKYQTIVVIPEVLEKGEDITYINLHIAITDSLGNINALFSEDNCWVSDAMRITQINLQGNPNEVKDGKPSIGIIINTENNSAMHKLYMTELSLFYKNGNKIERALKRFTLASTSSFEEVSKTIVTDTKMQNNGFYNLNVTKNTREYKIDDNGEEETLEESKKKEVLTYINGSYKTE